MEPEVADMVCAEVDLVDVALPAATLSDEAGKDWPPEEMVERGALVEVVWVCGCELGLLPS